MIPLRLELTGFMSYRDCQEFDYSEADLWMLEGPNGSGKSTVFDAITYALFGHYRGGQQNVKYLINQDAPGFEVVFDFTLKGQDYRIRRNAQWKLNRKGIRQDNADKTEHIYRLPGETLLPESPDIWVKQNLGLSYDSFTSSVLLLQGESNKLIGATGAERKKILKRFIDLSRFEALEIAAKERGKNHTRTVTHLRSDLDKFKEVTAETVAAADKEEKMADSSFTQATVQLTDLGILVEKATNWENTNARLQKQQQELQELEGLETRRAEIETNYHTLQELSQLLPRLQKLVAKRDELANRDQRLKHLAQELAGLEKQATQDLAQQTAMADQLKTFEDTLKILKDAQITLFKSLADVIPLTQTWNMYRHWQKELGKVQDNLNTLPTDLANQLAQTITRQTHLQILDRAINSLTVINEKRAGLEVLVDQQTAAQAQHEALEAQIVQDRTQLASLQATHITLADKESDLKADLRVQAANFQQAKAKLAHFERLETGQKCENCGQEITADHMDKELSMLRQSLQDADSLHMAASNTHKQALVDLQESGKNIRQLEKRLDKQFDDLAIVFDARQAAETSVSLAMTTLDTNYSNLPGEYQTIVAVAAPLHVRQWLATEFPTASEIQAFRQELKEQAAINITLKNIEANIAEKATLEGQKATLDDNLARLRSEYDIVSAEKAVPLKERLDTQQIELEAQIKAATSAIAPAQQAHQVAVKVFDKTQGQIRQNKQDAAGLEGSRSEIQVNIASLMAEIPAKYHAVNMVDVLAVKNNIIRLTSYGELYSNLQGINQRQETIRQIMVSLENELAKVPEAAQRPANQLNAELAQVRDKQQQTQAAWSAATQKLAKLQNDFRERQEKEAKKQEAEHLAYLYKTLGELLADLQTFLFKQRESLIVEYANKTLNNLSDGLLFLELKQDDASDDALNLLVYNYATGTKPTLVNMVSGSQKFRIAVSLALAIGQFASQDVRLIESVIIDEGFGSLDKTSREDMIEELHNLKKLLSKIILVSHQEEFANAFPNRYQIKLEGKASSVSLVKGT